MSVVLRMDMPKNNCEMAVEIKYVGDWCPIAARVCDYYSTKKMPDWCPIICQLPDGHGRLVDMRDIEQMEVSASEKQDKYFVGWNDAIKICQTATTIVPAEAERSET